MYENVDDNGKTVKCRKAHFCEWCDETIFPGEKAVRRVYKWDGDFHDSRMHPECYEALRNSTNKNLLDYDGEFTSGNQGRGCLAGEFQIPEGNYDIVIREQDGKVPQSTDKVISRISMVWKRLREHLRKG